MQLKFTIPGTIRIKKNSRRIYGFGKFKKVLPSKAYMEWESQARARFVMEHFQFPVIDSFCHVEVTAYFKGPEPDLSGILESVGDCLQGLAWEDDSLIFSWDGSRKYHNKDNARTEIIVEW